MQTIDFLGGAQKLIPVFFPSYRAEAESGVSSITFLPLNCQHRDSSVFVNRDSSGSAVSDFHTPPPQPLPADGRNAKKESAQSFATDSSFRMADREDTAVATVMAPDLSEAATVSNSSSTSRSRSEPESGHETASSSASSSGRFMAAEEGGVPTDLEGGRSKESPMKTEARNSQEPVVNEGSNDNSGEEVARYQIIASWHFQL